MKKFLLGFGAGFVFAGLVAFVLGIAVVAVIGRGAGPAPLGDTSVLVLDIGGAMPEQASPDITQLILSQEVPLTVTETWQLMRKAAADRRIKALVIEPQGLESGWATLQELRAQVVKFKESGKPVYAYLRGPTARDYYIASAADQVFMSPEDWLDVKGLRAELTFFKGTLDKLGVGLEFEAVGLYKDAPDTYTETAPSPQTLEVTNAILDQYYGNLVSVIAEGRKKTPEEIRAVIDRGPFLGQEAVDAGLLDGLLYTDQVYDRVKERLNASEDPRKVRASEYAKMPVSGFGGGTRIAVVTGEGEITRGVEGDVPLTGITSAAMAPLLRRVAGDDDIKGVIVRINSGGGDAIASDEILHEMKRLSAKKPLVISMGDAAASGGYYMAMTGDPILAYPNTLTGSIGVFYGKVNVNELFDKIGINTYLLQRGKYAAIDTATRPLTPDERAKLRAEIEIFYKSFVQLVADTRKRPYNEVEPLAQGRVWLGTQAGGNGLVDELGGLDRAVEMIRERAKIPGSEAISLVMYPARRSLLQMILNRDQPETGLESAVDRMVGPLPWRSMAEGGVMRLMPYSLSIH